MNAIKKKREIVWIDWLPHQGGRPHLPEVPHFHVNRPLMYLSMLSRWGGRPGIGGAFELS